MGGAVPPARGQLMLMMLVWVELYLPHTSHKGPADDHDARLGGAAHDALWSRVVPLEEAIWWWGCTSGKGPADAHDARLGGAVPPARGQLMLMMLVWVGLYRPHTSHKGPADAHDARLGGAEG